MRVVDSGPFTIVVVGLGAAGLAALEQARKRAPGARIVAISDEPIPAYFRPQLSHRLAVPIDPPSLLMKRPEWYAENRIELMLGTRVVRLSVDERCVELATGGSVRYDACVLSTGSSSFLPPVRGRDLPGVFSLRSVADAESIRLALSRSEKPVVVGGGPLGLEAAWAMASAGRRVTVLERGDRILKRQLDEEGSSFLHSLLAKTGIDVLCGAETEELAGTGGVELIRLKGSRELGADLVLFSAGVRPNADVARVSGLRVNNGILVDDGMRTSAESVYAAGDVAEHRNRIPAVMPVASVQGRVAGANAAVGGETYVEPDLAMVISIMGVSIASIGEVGGQFNLAYRDGTQYLKVFFRDDRPMGAVSIGDAGRIAILRRVVAEGAPVPGARDMGSALELLSVWNSSK